VFAPRFTYDAPQTSAGRFLSLKRSVPYIGKPTHSPDAVCAIGLSPRPCFWICVVSKKDRTIAVKPVRQMTYKLIDFDAAALKARSHLSRLSLFETGGHCKIFSR